MCITPHSRYSVNMNDVGTCIKTCNKNDVGACIEILNMNDAGACIEILNMNDVGMYTCIEICEMLC